MNITPIIANYDYIMYGQKSLNPVDMDIKDGKSFQAHLEEIEHFFINELYKDALVPDTKISHDSDENEEESPAIVNNEAEKELQTQMMRSSIARLFAQQDLLNFREILIPADRSLNKGV